MKVAVVTHIVKGWSGCLVVGYLFFLFEQSTRAHIAYTPKNMSLLPELGN